MNQPEEKHGLSDFSIRYPVTICMIFISIMIMGLISMWKIPLVLFPNVQQPYIVVQVPYRNATPGQVQETITKPLEEVLSTVPGVQRMSSNSRSDFTYVALFFDWDTDMDIIRAEIREKVEQIRGDLPDDVEQIRIQNWETEDIPIIMGRIASGRDLRTAADFLDLKIKKPLEQIPGVAEVEIWGARAKEIDIYLRLDALNRYRIDVADLFRRLDAANLNYSLGRLIDGGLQYAAISRGSVGSVEEIKKYPVNDRGLVLSDIADIEYDNPNVNFGQHLNGEYAVGFSIRKTSEANTVETVNQVLAKIEDLDQDPSLEGIELLPWRNAGEEITKSLTGLLTSGAIGAVLAGLVLLLFVRRFGATLVIALSIPFSIIAAVGFLYAAGNTLNVLTMLGLMLATGMLVDCAIVVLESIYQKLEKGMDRLTAARVGTGEVHTAVIAATLTSIIIFVPLIFGEKSDFSVWLSHTGIALIFALLASLFISLTLIPLAMARWLHMNVDRRTRFERLMLAVARPAAKRSGPVTDLYLRSVAWPLRHRFLVGLILIPALVAGSGWLLMNKIPDNSPDANELGQVQVQYEFSENFHYAKIEQDYVTPVEEFLLANKERFKITDVFSRYGNDNAGTELYFDKERITLEELEGIRKQISEGLPVLPGAEIRVGNEGGRGRNWISASLYGDDPQTLQELANEARRRLLARPDFDEVYTALDRAQEEVQIRIHPDLARRYGVSAQSVSDVLAIALRGRQVRGYRTPEGEVDIFVWLAPEDRDGMEDLESVIVGRNQDGQEILLTQVADLEVQKIAGELEREDRRTYTQLRAVFNGEKRDEGMKHVSEVMDGLDYPQDYGWSYGFWTTRQQGEDMDFVFNILMALFMVYFVMASLFESLAQPFAIMLSLPFSLVGIAGFLYVTGTPFNLMAKIGILVLIGIVVNNGIVLIDHIGNLRRKGMRRSEAVLMGCRERLRPIVMTAGTTIVGLMPLAFSDSSMLDMRYFPMARTIMGGLLASTILTLIVLPTYYTLVDDLARWLKRTWHASARSEQPKALDAPSV